MESNQALALPSTSQETFPRCLEQENDNEAAARCLHLIGNVALKMKSDAGGFVDILQKVLAVMEDQTINRDTKYDLIDKVMLNIIEADEEELILLNDDFKEIFSKRELKKLWVDDSALEAKEILGFGGFGIVRRGILKRPGEKPIDVGIKSANCFRYKEVIEHEASVMSQLNHRNVVKILAFAKSEPHIAMELMDLGNLVLAVEKMNFTSSNLLKFLSDVSNGMAYLHGKKYLHRDLACRNVFLNAKKKCKIGDFGFSVYVGDSGGVYLEKIHDPHGYNLSPETLASKKFTIKTDVWAMGILCWELFYITENAGKDPPTTFTKKRHLEMFQITQQQLPKPKLCPSELYIYVKDKLLERNPAARPTFAEIKATINELLSSS